MKNIIAGLLKVKSIITLILTVVFACFAMKGRLDANQVLTIYTTVIAFYFGTQSNKKE